MCTKYATKIMRLVTTVILISCMLVPQINAYCQKTSGSTAIFISGKVIDASTLKPVSNASIELNSQKYSSDDNGNFSCMFKVPSPKISFSLFVKKTGYGGMKDSENWGSDNTNCVRKMMLFIVIDKKDNLKEFVTGIPYTGINEYADGVYLDSAFYELSKNRHLAELSILRDSMRAYPDRIFFTINDLNFIASNTGYLYVDSGEDIVSVSGTIVRSIELNDKFKRKEIAGMTPIESDSSAAKVKLLIRRY